MYRVFDSLKHCWVKKNIYLAPNNDLFVSTKTLFGAEKLSLVSDNRYIWHKDIGLNDKNNVRIFEGDICKVEHLDIIGVIAYIPEYASYCLLDDKNLKYYLLGEDRCKDIEVIGNVFDNQDLLVVEESEVNRNADT